MHMRTFPPEAMTPLHAVMMAEIASITSSSPVGI